MEYGRTYSREQLLEIHRDYEKQKIFSFIDQQIVNGVLGAAKMGLTQYYWQMMAGIPHQKLGMHGMVAVNPPFPYEKIVQALKEKFPGTSVELQENWDKKKRILIDWS